jgi:hypothetical protein
MTDTLAQYFPREGKYPIAVGNRSAVFPLLGVDFKIVLSQEPSIDGGNPIGTLSNVWFKWGWGVDFGLTERIYLRHEIS